MIYSSDCSVIIINIFLILLGYTVYYKHTFRHCFQDSLNTLEKDIETTTQVFL